MTSRKRLHALFACLIAVQSVACAARTMGDPTSKQNQADGAGPADVTGESVSGTSIPTASQLVDANGVVWTVQNGNSYQNGVADTGANIVQLLYFDRTVYANTDYYGWWVWTSNGWTQAAGSPVAESTNGATIPGANQLVDAAGVIFAVKNGYSYQNGVADSGSNITELLYFNGAIYALNTSDEWWGWSNDSGWTQAAGDPTNGAAVVPQAPSQATAAQPQTNVALLGGCGNCDGVAALQGFESFINRSVDYVLVWGWAQTAGDLMYAFHYLEDMWPASYTLHYDVPMVLQNGTFAQVYDGSLDSVYQNVAQTIAGRDPNGIIRIGHEMNGNWYDWSQDGPAGSAAEFVLAYQHLVDIFRGVSPNFKFVWNPGAGKWAGIDFITTYPGDAYIDYISFDMYEDASFATMSASDRWNHFLDNDGRGLNWLAQFAGDHGKAIAFDEWASAIDDGVYITNMYNWITTHNVAYQMYWHSDAAFPGSFSDHPVNGATFKQLFGQ